VAEIKVEHARDESGYDRPGLLLATVAGRVVGTAARVAGSVPEKWIARRTGDTRHVTGLSEIQARELLITWAGEAAS